MDLLTNPVITLVVELIVLGFAAWLVDTAPFIEAQFKQIIKWVLIVVAGLLVAIFLLGLFGIKI